MKVVSETMGVQTLAELQSDGTLITGTQQDCTPIYEDAKARQNAGFTGSSEFKHAARLPLAIIEVYCNRNGITLEQWGQDPVHIKRMLSDPDLSGFRVWKGRVQ